MLRTGIRVTVKDVKDDGSLVVEHQPGEEIVQPLRNVWKLISRLDHKHP
jgi:hypothetical protein